MKNISVKITRKKRKAILTLSDCISLSNTTGLEQNNKIYVSIRETVTLILEQGMSFSSLKETNPCVYTC